MRDRKNWNEKQKLVYKYLEELGHPEEGICFIYVVGTNGKGSVGRSIALALQALIGKEVGHFLSPHIHKYNERIMLGKEAIDDESLAKIKKQINKISVNKDLAYPGYFINSFIEALLAFKGMKYAVIEAGIGALEDVTNILPFSFQVITKIGLDHTDILGHSLKEIAFQKSSSLPENKAAVSSWQEKEAKEEIKKIAKEKNVSITFANPENINNCRVNIKEGENNKASWTMSFDYEGDWLSGSYETRLVGLHQKENLSTALKAMELIFDPERNDFLHIKKFFPRGVNRIKIKEVIYEALNDLYLPGRFELVNRNPYVIVDGAHNDPAIKMLYKNLEWLGISESGKYGKAALVFGAHDGKISEEVRDYFFSKMCNTYVINIQDARDEKIKEDVDKALMNAINDNKNSVILIAGSLYILDLIY